jgi:Phage derived protein Gp49-like (DUF891)
MPEFPRTALPLAGEGRVGARRVVVVRAFAKKSRRTPRAEIELALRRAKEIA